jgi:hypothetical protein
MAIRFSEQVYADATKIISKPTGARLTFGVVPYAILWAEPSRYECVGCSLPRGSFDSDWGLSLTVAYDYYPEDPDEEFVTPVDYSD